MTRLELARQILAGTERIQKALQNGANEQLPALFEERQGHISDYLELEATDEGRPENEAEEKEIRQLMRQGYELNQKIQARLLQKRQALMQELTLGDQVREATNAYSSPYDNVREPMFFDKKK